MKFQEVPVLLLTGYLGSGKTTLVNKVLSNKHGIKFAVIVNDIGEVNIDADLIQQGGIVDKKDDSLVALQNGCICCTLKMDLVAQLRDITSLQKFDYIVIEASGVCEPAPIAQTICSIPTMGPEYIKGGIARLDCITTVVDALRMKDEFGNGENLIKQNIAEDDIENLVIQQIEFCNIILLNKASEVEPSELERLKEIITALQPHATIIECDYGNVDLDKIINTHLFDFDKVATSAAWIDEIEHHHDDEHDHEGGEVEEYGIGTFVYYRRKPFDLVGFDDFIASKWSKNIIRSKGICWFKDEPATCYVFEQAGKQMNLRNAGQWYATMDKDELADLMQREPGLSQDWNEQYGDRMQKLVFIGQHLDKDEITRQLDSILLD